MTKCLNREDNIPFKEINRCIWNIGDFCFISHFPISRIEHNCKYYEVKNDVISR